MPEFRVQHIDHLVLRVSDVEAMMDFYIETLGCSLEKINEAAGLYQLRAGACLIDLVPVDGRIGRMGGRAPGVEGRNLDHLCLRYRIPLWRGRGRPVHISARPGR